MERILAFLEMLVELLTTVPDAASMMAGVSTGVISILEAEACLVKWDGEREPVLAGPRAGLLEDGLPEGLARVLNWCRRRGQPLLLDDLPGHPLWGGMLFDLPDLVVRCLLCAPLWAGERAIGVIAVMNRLDGTLFTPEDQRALSAVAGQAALALENLRLRTVSSAMSMGEPSIVYREGERETIR
jgi:GAF domain-containing protein